MTTVFKKGQPVWDHMGREYRYEMLISDENSSTHLVEQMGVTTYVEEGEENTYTEPMNVFQWLSAEDIFTTFPVHRIPPYEARMIATAKTRIARLQRQLKETQEELFNVNSKVISAKVRTKELTKRMPELGIMLDFLEGVDMTVISQGEYGNVILSKLSELKGNYGLRMFSLNASLWDNKWAKTYEWKLHKYSDDSGSKFSAVAGKTREEAIERLNGYLVETEKLNLEYSEGVLKGFKELGATLTEKQEKQILADEAKRLAKQQAQKEREVNSALEILKRHGVTSN